MIWWLEFRRVLFRSYFYNVSEEVHSDPNINSVLATLSEMLAKGFSLKFQMQKCIVGLYYMLTKYYGANICSYPVLFQTRICRQLTFIRQDNTLSHPRSNGGKRVSKNQWFILKLFNVALSSWFISFLISFLYTCAARLLLARMSLCTGAERKFGEYIITIMWYWFKLE